MISALSPSSDFENDFLEIAGEIYRNYAFRLARNNAMDVSGLLWKAIDDVNHVKKLFVRNRGRERGNLSNIKYVLVDEFQDISLAMFSFLDAVRSVGQNVQFFCVGDDWQAINRFAGSDTTFFRKFDKYFPGSQKFHWLKNYRSFRSIVRASNNIMEKAGVPGGVAVSDKAGMVCVYDIADWAPLSAESRRHRNDVITPAALRLVWACVSQGQRVLVLVRARSLPFDIEWVVKHRDVDPLAALQEQLRSFLPESIRDMVTVNTAHAMKGKEDDAVIILDARDGRFPLIHPLWVVGRVFGDSLLSIGSDERRLFYVAATRAKEALYFVADGSRGSTFLAGLRRAGVVEERQWRELPAPPFVAIEAVVERGRHLWRFGFRPGERRAEDAPPEKWRKDVPEADFS